MPTCHVVSFYWWWVMKMLCDMWCLNHTCKPTFQPGKFWWHFILILPPYKACDIAVFSLCNDYSSAVQKHKEWVCKFTYIQILCRTVLSMLIFGMLTRKKISKFDIYIILISNMHCLVCCKLHLDNFEGNLLNILIVVYPQIPYFQIIVSPPSIVLH